MNPQDLNAKEDKILDKPKKQDETPTIIDRSSLSMTEVMPKDDPSRDSSQQGTLASDVTQNISMIQAEPVPKDMSVTEIAKPQEKLPEPVAQENKDKEKKYGRYLIRKILGKGGMGEVLLAYDPALDRTVALKVLSKVAVDEVERFHREARAVAKLKHPNIITIHDIGVENHQCFFTMEYIDGHTLSKILEEKKMPLEKLLVLFYKVVNAVAYAHSQGVIHRDIKPSNIMVDSVGEPHVMDFGLAKVSGDNSDLTQSGTILGSPHYMSPEQAEGKIKDVDQRSDVFSLGIVLYEILAGIRPFDGETTLRVLFNIISKPVRPPREILPNVPARLEEICLKAMSRDKNSRYASAQEMLLELKDFLISSHYIVDDVKAASGSKGARPKKQKSWLWKPAFVAIVLVVIVGCFIGRPMLFPRETKNTTDTAKNTTDTAKNTTDTAKNTTDAAKNTTDANKNTTDTAKNTTDTAKNTTDAANPDKKMPKDKLVGNKPEEVKVSGKSDQKKAGIRIADEWYGLPPAFTRDLDDVVCYAEGRFYMLKGQEYVRYDYEQNMMDKDYPVKISEYWPGLWPDKVDASIRWPNGKVYFFKGDEYIRFDIKSEQVEKIPPKKIKDGWKGIWERDIDAAINWDDRTAYFFKGDEYIRYDIKSEKAEPPAKIQHGIWPELNWSKVDAAVRAMDSKCYLFSGDRYMEFNSANDGTLLLGPTISLPQEDSVYIWWHLKEPATEHKVWYGLSEGKFSLSASLTKTTTSPYVQIKGLKPGKTYFFQMASGEWTSNVYDFYHPNPRQKIRIGFWGDNQHGYSIFARQTVSTLIQKDPDVVMALGDVVSNGGIYQDWHQQFYGPAENLLNGTPMFSVRGNHDDESPLAHEMYPTPNDQPWYSCTYGYIRLVVMNTNLPYNANSPQHEWLKKEIGLPEWKQAGYRFVAFHLAPFTNLWDRIEEGADGNKVLRTDVFPLLLQAQTDVVLCGHVHAYQRGEWKTSTGKLHYFVLGGGGGDLDTVRSASWPEILVASSSYHVMVASVTKEKIEIEVIDTANRKILDSLTIQGNEVSKNR